MSDSPTRYETNDDYRNARPIHVVWEVTLGCNLKCVHCGSRAGAPRRHELSTAECFDLIGQLARLGVREVTLIGGEVHLRDDWVNLIREIKKHGMVCSIQTGGRGFNGDKARLASEAGLDSCGVSIDGLAPLHDRLRGVAGSYVYAIEALRALSALGVPTSVNTQITSQTLPDLRPLLHQISEVGVKYWQVQLTVAMGRAADHSELLLQPFDLLELMPLLAELHAEAEDLGIVLEPGNNIGYFGPYEHLWRIVDSARGHWSGCTAGHTTIGIEADGTIKGCPSLPRESYGGGNIRDMQVQQMWELSQGLRVIRDRTVEDLWGHCRTCYYADVCRSGCTWTSHVLFGRAGNNPFCHYRALELSKQGLRERIRKVASPVGIPFDYGRFDLIVERLDGSGGGVVVPIPPVLAKITPNESDAPGRVPPVLKLCHGCHQYVKDDPISCPYCGGDLESLRAEYESDLQAARVLTAEVMSLLPQDNQNNISGHA